MCFSATASFTASAVLAVIGALSVRKVTTRNELLFASLSLLFAAQQLIEGSLWLAFKQGSLFSTHFLTQFYIIFVGILWPILVPTSLWMIERVAWRKKAMLAVIISGIGIAVFTINGLWQFPVTARIADYCIAYDYPTIQPHFMLTLYVFATCAAFFIASQPPIRLIGAINLLAFFVTYYFYSYDLASVWCFFAAIISGSIYLYFDKQFLGNAYFLHILKPLTKNQ